MAPQTRPATSTTIIVCQHLLRQDYGAPGALARPVLRGHVTTMATSPPPHELQLREAKATLSAVIDKARRGEPSVITRHGRREAVVLGFEEWERLSRVPSFGRLLMAAPVGPGDLDRDTAPAREADV